MTHATSNTTSQDPVCGMEVDIPFAKYTSEYKGTTYFFCSRMCQKAFEDDPQQYLTQRPESQR